jgi:hypothetical protein
MAITEARVKELIEKETKITKDCLDKLSKDMADLRASQRRIERVLLGDKDYEDKGLAHMVNYSYDYARRNTEMGIVDRAIPALEWYERNEKEGKWKILNEIVDKYKALKWLSVIVTGGAAVTIIEIVVDLIERFS